VRADKRNYPKLLIVEGMDDRHSVVGLMKNHIHWPEEPRDWPVYIEVGKSVEEILAADYLSTEMKASHVTTMGVMLDADEYAIGRYQRIQQLMTGLFPTLPVTMQQGGLVIENLDGKRFGLWLMPDNESEGDLETFLKYLVPKEQDEIWNLACDSVKGARNKGAPCHDSHVPKANLYTWLAWQEPPGQSPGLALTKRILDPQSPYAGAFVAWFKDLYRIA
jgi:hypothetical protein